jgi:hypothetical protein
MNFSPAYISSLIVQPLRYLYGKYVESDILWNIDPKISGIEIDTINNYNKIAIQTKPRILVSRGEYSIRSMGLTDSLAEGSSSRSPGPKIERRFMMVNGVSQILIESLNEGTCERLVEKTENFLAMSGPMIANYHGFKQFAMPLSVSSCVPGKEEVETFSCTINIPWARELSFQVVEDGLEFKNFILSITS